MSAKLIIAIDCNSSHPIHISDVDKTIRIIFTCPGCSAEVIPVKGEINEHHFRHKGSLEHFCNETALHAYAKQLICDNSSLQIHNKIISYSKSEKEAVVDKFRSDVKAIYNNKPIHFEIIVHNDLHVLKESYYHSSRINSIRIDLTDPQLLKASPEAIKKAVLLDKHNKEKIYWSEDDQELYCQATQNKNWIIGGAIIVGALFFKWLFKLGARHKPYRKTRSLKNRKF